MSAAAGPVVRAPFVIPLAAGPVAPWLDRLVASLVAGLGVASVLLLWGTEPAAAGHGTHEQLGLSPCSWPRVHGGPCPTCGCTTAASLVIHGRLVAAVAVQPFGAVVAIAGLGLALHALACLLRGWSFVDLLVRLPLPRLGLGAVLLCLAAWLYTWTTFVP